MKYNKDPAHFGRILFFFKTVNLGSFNFNTIQRWGSVLTLVLTTLVIVPATSNSGIAKEPIYVIGALFAVTILCIKSILDGKVDFPVSPIHIVVALLVPLLIVSALLSFDPVYSWSGLSLSAGEIVFFFLGCFVFTTKKDLLFLLDSLEWTTLILCVTAALQLFIPAKLPVNFYLEAHGRVPSLLGNSAFFSSYLVVVFPLVLSQALDRRSANETGALHFALLAVMAILLLSTQTRSSIVGWLISLTLFVFLTWKMRHAWRPGLVVGIFLAGIVVYAFVLQPEVSKRFSAMFRDNPESTLARRVYFWNAGRDAFVASPVFGHGLGSFERIVFKYRAADYWTVRSEDIVPHAHNELIEIAVEHGSLGLAVCGVVIFLTLRRVSALLRQGQGWRRWMVAGLTCSLVAVAIDNLANVSLRQPPIAALVWLLAGLLWSPVFTGERARTISFPLRTPKIIAAIPLVLWIGFVAAYSKYEMGQINSVHRMMNAIAAEGTSSEAALAEYQVAVADDPANLIARSNLTRMLLNTQHWGEALSSAEDLQRLSPLYPKSNLMKAYALLHLGRYAESLESVQKEVSERSHPEAFWVQASAYRAMSDNSGERGAIVNLLKNDIEAGTPFEYQAACHRLVDLTRTPQEMEETNALLNSIENVVTNNSDFFKNLRSQRALGH